MECSSCHADVYPVRRMMRTGQCQGCQRSIFGIEKIEGLYACTCGHNGVLTPRYGMQNQCPACNAGMPDTEIVAETTQPKQPSRQPAQAQRVPESIGEPEDVIAKVRARLAFCDERIAELRGYESEAAKLRRMLAVIDDAG